MIVGIQRNQFGHQQPGTGGDIAEFRQIDFGLAFPLTEKIDVNGYERHPLYKELVATPDEEGYSGDIRWNFGKFLVAPDGTVATRCAPQTDPQDAGLTAAVEKLLPR